MKGPYSVSRNGDMVQRGMTHDEEQIHAETTRSKYESEDKALECELLAITHTGSKVRVGFNENGKRRQEPEDRFEISPLKGGDKLLDIAREQKIGNEFPIVCKTLEEAEEKLRKLLGDC